MTINTPLNSQIPTLRKLWQEAFGDTEEFLNTFFSTAFLTDHCRCVTADEKVAAALYWFDCLYADKPIAYIYAVATAKAFQGQGICHKLMEDTHRHLEKSGYQGAILVPGSEELFYFYEKIGYKTCSQIRKFHCTAIRKDISLTQIDQREYARLRRKLLPKGGVIQEDKNLNFLQTQAQFYAGSDFVLACHGEGDILHGIELLGNDSAAPEIVHTLGYDKGSFRTPGKGTPFAMYYSLKKDHCSPTYFGLAFD